MELKQYRFPRGELICYEQQENFVSGEAYVLVMGSLKHTACDVFADSTIFSAGTWMPRSSTSKPALFNTVPTIFFPIS